MARLSDDTVAELVNGTSPTAVGDATRQETVAATLDRLGIPYDRDALADADRIPASVHRAILLATMAREASEADAAFLRREAERAAPGGDDPDEETTTEEARP